MDNFILWGASFDKQTLILSFFATRTGVQRINLGTREVITTMLDDLAISDHDFDGWFISKFVTDYLQDDPPSDDWQDNWMETSEIKLQLNKSVDIPIKDYELVRTYIHDTTWQGERAFLPSDCVIVADFYHSEHLHKARQILEMTKQININAKMIDVLVEQFAEIPRVLFDELEAAYQQRRHIGNVTFPSLDVHQRAGFPLQLIISLGTVDEQFFLEGANLAFVVSELMHELSGTTTWNERTDPSRLEA